MADKLSLDDFFDLLGRYGSDVCSWPLSRAQMDSVVGFLARSSLARDAVEEMRLMETGLGNGMPRAPVGLADRILAAAGVARHPGRPILALPRLGRPTLN